MFDQIVVVVIACVVSAGACGVAFVVVLAITVLLPACRFLSSVGSVGHLLAFVARADGVLVCADATGVTCRCRCDIVCGFHCRCARLHCHASRLPGASGVALARVLVVGSFHS